MTVTIPEFLNWEALFGPLGGSPLRPDFRDEPLSAHQQGVEAVTPFAVDHHSEQQPWLNQGKEGACVGHGATNFLNANPYPGTRDSAWATALYREITTRDSFRGDWTNGQSGTSIRAGGDELKRRGLIKAYAFAADIDVMLKHLRDVGPVFIGVPWFRSADRVDPDGFTRVWGNSGIRGWHCVAIDAVNMLASEPYFLYPNSWGDRRRFKFSFPAMEYMLNHSGAGLIAAVERRLT